MKRLVLLVGLVAPLLLPLAGSAQEAKQQVDTLTIQAEATYEADPDLATLVFDVSAQEKELRKAYDRATAAMQRIVQLAERNGLAKDDISVGRFTVTPITDWGDKKQKARAYRVAASLTLRLHEFQRIGTLIDDSVQEGITEFRSLAYSLADEEAAKQSAIAQAMRCAENRARAALGQGGRKLGPLRYASVDVKQPTGVVRVEGLQIQALPLLARGAVAAESAATSLPAVPAATPEKIKVTATVQCVFQLQ
jgi:hypothetical protein